MNEKELASKKNAVISVLTLLFPNIKIIFTPRSILLNCDGVNVTIDEGNFEILQHVLKDIFCLSGDD